MKHFLLERLSLPQKIATVLFGARLTSFKSLGTLRSVFVVRGLIIVMIAVMLKIKDAGVNMEEAGLGEDGDD